MRNNSYLVSLVVAIVVMIGWACFARGQGQHIGRPQWEYKLASSPADTESMLKQAGSEGWELAVVSGGTFIFKRPK